MNKKEYSEATESMLSVPQNNVTEGRVLSIVETKSPAFSTRAGDNMIEFEYVCTKQTCRAKDRGRYFPEEPPALMINCWKCHAGTNKSVEDMIARSEGMRIVLPQGVALSTRVSAAQLAAMTAQPKNH